MTVGSRALLAMVLTALAAWLFSWHLASVMLARDSAAKAKLESACETPFRWRFRAEDDLIPQGTQGMELSPGHAGLKAAVSEANAHLMLRLPRPIDTRMFPQADLSLCSSEALSIGLGSGDRVIARERLAVGCQSVSLIWDKNVPATLTDLRLHVLIGEGAVVEVLSVEILRDCSVNVPRVQLSTPLIRQTAERYEIPHATLRLAPSLAVRDRLLDASPEASLLGPWSPPEFAGSRLMVILPWLLIVLLPWLVLADGSVKARLTHWPVMLFAGAAGLALYSGLGLMSLIAGSTAVGLAWFFRDELWALMASPGAPEAWREMALMIVACGAGLAVLGDGDFELPGAGDALRYLLWALGQQLILCGLIPALLDRTIVRQRDVAVAAALMFGVLHLPNLELAVLTSIAGWIWVHASYRWRSIWPQTVAHATLGVVLASTAAPWQVYSLQAGIAFFR